MKIKKMLLKTIKIITAIFLLFILALFIYTIDSSSAEQQMYDQIETLDLQMITKIDSFDSITYKVDHPIKNIVFIPGGKVKPESYEYLAISLALASYDVTIVKPVFNLAILTPKYFTKFLSDSLDNVLIGHSLGGTVSSIVAEGDQRVTDVIFLASYSITDLTDKNVLTITAENDMVLDLMNVEESKVNLNSEAVYIEILGGNHAGFGWYGIQKGDGIATISTMDQQNLVINAILNFI